MNSAIKSLDTVDISSNDKAATIYRTGALNYRYVCSHCNVLFTNISDTLDHIEAHYYDENAKLIAAKESEILLSVQNTDNDRMVDDNNDQYAKSNVGDSCFQCNLCDQNYGLQDHLDHHLKEHFKHYRCKFCDVVQDTEPKLLGHLIQMHVNATRLVCSICSEDFVCKSQFIQHLQNHVASKDISYASIVEDIASECGNCDEICVELKVEECDTELLQCDICESEFDTKNKLKSHMKEMHVPKHIAFKRGMYMCDQCNRNIQGKLLFYAHQYAHLMNGNEIDSVDDASLLDKLKKFLNANILYDELDPNRAYGCKICCHLSVKRRKNIEAHILQEHVYRLKYKKRMEKRYPCDYCGQRFTLSHNMIVHKRIHTREKPYTCLICNKSFSHSSYMKYHEKVHSGLCTHQCSTCGLSFKSKTKLNMHNKVHSSETTKCTICGKEFKSHRLNVHIKHVHQNEHRPYKCTVCSQAFKTAKTLKTHSYRHSGEKKYKCRFHCDERFTSTAGRRGHERSKHETNLT